mmetsp:Transcript_67320/g.146537  ORF Transcript_67320/g.146537 Transcript_67320/m.146537 type:complete len:208 (-) Transcript_67320:1183-1806(-)
MDVTEYSQTHSCPGQCSRAISQTTNLRGPAATARAARRHNKTPSMACLVCQKRQFEATAQGGRRMSFSSWHNKKEPGGREGGREDDPRTPDHVESHQSHFGECWHRAEKGAMPKLQSTVSRRVAPEHKWDHIDSPQADLTNQMRVLSVGNGPRTLERSRSQLWEDASPTLATSMHRTEGIFSTSGWPSTAGCGHCRSSCSFWRLGPS